MINNRQQSGRRRGRGGQRQNGSGQGNGRPGDTGNRIDNRSRGNAAQLLEKYKTLARDAQQAGDRVLAEYYFQFADHYFRVLAETRARYEEANPNARRPQEFADGEGFDDENGDSDGDGDNFGDYDAPRENQREARPQQQQPQRTYREDRPQQERPQQQDRPQQDRTERAPREDRPQRDDRPQREDRPQRDERPARAERPPREDRPRRDEVISRPREPYRPAGNGAAHDDEADVGLPFDALPPAIGVTSADPVPDLPMGVEGEPVPVPRKRGRPRKVVEVAPGE